MTDKVHPDEPCLLSAGSCPTTWATPVALSRTRSAVSALSPLRVGAPAGVGFIVDMPLGAVSFTTILTPDDAPLEISFISDGIEMSGADTVTVATEMIPNESVWWLPCEEVVGADIQVYRGAEHAVPVTILACSPEPTFIGLFDFAPEPLFGARHDNERMSSQCSIALGCQPVTITEAPSDGWSSTFGGGA